MSAKLVGASTEQLVDGVQRKLDELRARADEIKALRAQLATGRAGELAARPPTAPSSSASTASPR